MVDTQPDTSQRRSRILVVDDDIILTRRIGELFHLSGYSTVRAHSGTECLSMLQADDTFDAIILDIGLGEREPHGGEVAVAIRDRYGIPVVFYTGHTDRETIALTRDTDSFGLVVKAPDDEEILLASVEAAIRRARIERETAERFHTYREILHWMPTPVCVFERSTGSPVFTNDAAARYFGERSREEYDRLFDEAELPATLDEVPDGADRSSPAWRITGPLVDRGGGGHWLVAARELPDGSTARAYYDVTRLCAEARRIGREAENARALLRDVHHRVKNNLAVVDALLGMTQHTLDEPGALDTVRTQVRAVQELHDRLHASQRHVSVDIAEYLERIARSSLPVIDSVRLETAFELRDQEVPSEIALPLGLIVAELATNASKHSFVNHGDHWFRLTLRDRDERTRCELVVEYDGVPLPPDEVLDRATGSGLTLIRGLVRQLEAELTIEREPHNAFRIRFRTP